MKVKATKQGFYGMKRIYPGTIFEIEDKLFSSLWMENLEPKVEAKPRTTKGKEAWTAATKDDGE